MVLKPGRSRGMSLELTGSSRYWRTPPDISRARRNAALLGNRSVRMMRNESPEAREMVR